MIFIKMIQKAFICISFFFFVLSSSFATSEQFLPNFQADSRTSLSTGDPDSSPGINHTSGLLNRLLRGKFSVKSSSNFNTTTHEIPLTGWIHETFFSPPFSKHSVYQQINVYRI
jgi:hypothetical protein